MPDTRVPDELVQAVHDASTPGWGKAHAEGKITEHVLDAVPDGWGKIDGEWRLLTPFQQRLIQHKVTDVEQEQ